MNNLPSFMFRYWKSEVRSRSSSICPFCDRQERETFRVEWIAETEPSI
ncbi:hypothetical protein ACFQ5B_10795 [Laceyella putida]|uniref:Uncharacterized protein n=1 Tax=Laceyella putida TaxID=110101 RepID=A0ABW2RJN2_9BACL